MWKRRKSHDNGPIECMEVEPNEEVVRLRALVTELQNKRVQEKANRTKKARTPGVAWILRIVKVVMSTLIDAADSTLRQAGRGVQ